ncbi:hypothetical protein [Sulfobacillus thermosulfidooxidans]|uniref:hypothetical protein n=1 Tax=Sulfobacillus thermosulfidooxidans TaxID=28034 RepID=UPI0002E9629C|nr:hypothetical protein [Sulfobacillus thermosulfidooxidans]
MPLVEYRLVHRRGWDLVRQLVETVTPEHLLAQVPWSPDPGDHVMILDGNTGNVLAGLIVRHGHWVIVPMTQIGDVHSSGDGR